MKKLLDSFRMLLGIILGLAFLGIIPIRSQPFPGCDSVGYSTLVLGCTSWVYLFSGLGMVLLISVIGPKKMKPHFWGLVMVILLSLFGGTEAIKHGDYVDIFSNPEAMLYYWRWVAVPMTLGAVIACGIIIATNYVLHKKIPNG